MPCFYAPDLNKDSAKLTISGDEYHHIIHVFRKSQKDEILLTNGSGLMAKAMPTSIEGVVELVASLTDYASGKGNLFRSPKEVTEYVKALREGAKTPDEKEKDEKTPVVFRRAATVIVG